LAARRRYPLAVFWCVILMSAIHPDVGDATAKIVACTVAAYSVAMHSPYRPAALISLAAAVAAIAGIYQHAIP
jgi:di/tricarboxylate transporter